MDLPSQGLEKLQSGHCGQVDFSASKVTFHSHMPPMGKSPERRLPSN